MPSVRDQFPLRVVLNGKDVTFSMGEGFTFSNTDPGGYEAASIPLPKDMPELVRGDPVRIECGLSTVWEGRVKEIQRSLGAKTLVQCEGYRAILKEHTMAEIFVDRDLTKWQGPSVTRQKEAVGAGQSPSGAESSFSAAGNPALITGFTGPWVAGGLPISEAWFDSRGIAIGAVYWAWTRGGNVNNAEEQWAWEVVLRMGENGTFAPTTTGNQRAPGPNSGTLEGAHLFAQVLLKYTAAGGTANTLYQIFWETLALYGTEFRHSPFATGRGSNPVGYYPDQIVSFVSRECPGVQIGRIDEAAQITIPHASYLTPVPIEQIISDMARFAGWHWGVWESLTYLTGSQTPRVDFRAGPPKGAPTAWCWRRECETVDIRENIENLYDSAKVTYTEPGGVERSVEVSKSNPALEAASLHRQVNLSFGTGTKEAAEVWGLIQLDLLADQARMTGTASITDLIHSMGGAQKPAWMLRAGLDRLRIPDLPCSDVWGEHNDLPITRVECSGSSTGLTTSVEFGNSVNLIETLAAQLQANLTAQVR